MERDTTDEADSTDLRMTGVSAVTWIDDDGTKYRREMKDGEPTDTVIGHE